MKDRGLRYSASNPELNNRIYTKIDPNKDTVYWYIKFNMPLDPSSVNSKSMRVTDVGGYVLRTYIEYSTENNLITISPIDSYTQGNYYILTLTTKVRSAKGNNLPKEVHIVFKLIKDEISEFEIMKSMVDIPLPKQRPTSYDISKVKSKVNGYHKSLDTSSANASAEVPLGKLKIPINYLPTGASYLLLILSFFIGNFIIILVCLIMAILASLYVLSIINKKENKATMYYNIGVSQFNKENYNDAKVNFRKAKLLDKENKTIEYANMKIDFYID